MLVCASTLFHSELSTSAPNDRYKLSLKEMRKSAVVDDKATLLAQVYFCIDDLLYHMHTHRHTQPHKLPKHTKRT
jgi:hypothetical protein